MRVSLRIKKQPNLYLLAIYQLYFSMLMVPVVCIGAWSKADKLIVVTYYFARSRPLITHELFEVDTKRIGHFSLLSVGRLCSLFSDLNEI